MLYLFVFNTAIIAAAVGFHFEVLNWLSIKVPQMRLSNRHRVVIALLGAILAHIIEIWGFALAYLFIIRVDDNSSLVRSFDGGLYDSFYFSISTYTTVGYGDIEPLGGVRYLAGLEALTGLVLITWTASFLFIEMQKYWSKRA